MRGIIDKEKIIKFLKIIKVVKNVELYDHQGWDLYSDICIYNYFRFKENGRNKRQINLIKGYQYVVCMTDKENIIVKILKN